MKNNYVIITFGLFCLVNVTNGFSQNNKIGGSAIYNVHTNSLGLGFRADIPLKSIDLLEGIGVVPQLAYYPSFDPITEFYLGLGANLGIYRLNNWKFYTLAELSYNGWINNDDVEYREGNFSNLGVEVGIGASVKVKKCWYPFFECRYNVWWNEIAVQLGILYTLKCERRGAVPCSKIPPQPQF
jgi:hypothetical protein